MGRLNPKIGLIVLLQDNFKTVHDQYARYADTEGNIHLSDVERKAMTPKELEKVNRQN